MNKELAPRRRKIKIISSLKKKVIFALLAVLFLVIWGEKNGNGSLLSGLSKEKEIVKIETKEVTINNDWKYVVYLPKVFDISKKYPLVLCLHGFGGKAKDYLGLWAKDADQEGYIVAALQAYPKQYPDRSIAESYPLTEIGQFMETAISDIEDNYKIDKAKVFLTGHSAGAATAYAVALDSNIKFKGIIPIDGYIPPMPDIEQAIKNAVGVNFYVVHGANDNEVNAVIEQEKVLERFGAKMEFRILPGVGHEYPAAEHQNIIRWMNSLR